MSVDDMSFPSKSLEFSSYCLDITSVHGFLGLAKSININDCDEIVKFVVTTKIYCFPNATLSNLSISTNTKYCVVNLIEILARISHSACHRKSLAQRSSCDIHEWNLWNWMPLNYWVFESQWHQLFLSDGSCSVKGRIQNWSWMSFWKDQSIIQKMVGILTVEFQSRFVEEKDWKYVGNWWAWSWMTTFGDVDRSNWVNSQPMGDVLVKRVIDFFFDFFLTTSGLIVVGFAWSASFSSSHKICFK